LLIETLPIVPVDRLLDSRKLATGVIANHRRGAALVNRKTAKLSYKFAGMADSGHIRARQAATSGQISTLKRKVKRGLSAHRAVRERSPGYVV
jgi:hypothetical protein